MKRIAILTIVLLSINIASNAQNSDIFSVVAPSGQTIYCRIYGIGTAQIMPQYDPYTSTSYVYDEGAEPTGNLIIPDSVEYNGVTYEVGEIGPSSFYGCSGLSSVTLPPTIRVIWGSAFQNCTGLTTITIPANVYNIYGYAFRNCTNLTTVFFNAENCVSMESYDYLRVFSNCTSLVKLVVGENVTNIPPQAFKECQSLDTVILLPQTPPTLGNDAFWGNAETRKFYIPCGTYDVYSDFSPRVEPAGPDFALTVQSNNDNLGQAFNITEDYDIRCDSTAIVTAQVTEPYHFLKWNHGSTSLIDTIKVTSDTTITAVFVQLTVNSDNEAQGQVSHQKQGNLIEYIQATPVYGNHFVRWSNGSTQQAMTINLTGDSVLTAYFAPNGGTEGIGDEAGADFKLYCHNGEIVVEGAECNTVALYDNAGRLLLTRQAENKELHLTVSESGVFHVKVGCHPARKIVVIK